MKTKFLSVILALFIVQPCVCFADSSSSLLEPVEFEVPISTELEDGTITNTTADVKSFFDKQFSLGKDNDYTLLASCRLKNTDNIGYDNMRSLIAIQCGENDIFRASVRTSDSKKKSYSQFGELFFMVPKGNFSVKIKSDEEVIKNCNIDILGIGYNKTAEPGYPIDVECKFENKISSSTILKPIVAFVTGAVALLNLF